MMDHDCHADELGLVRLFSRLPWFYFYAVLGLVALESQGLSSPALRRLGLPIIVLPWASGLVLLPILRTGPLKNWAIPWLISLAFPMIALKFGVDLTRASLSVARASTLFVLVFFVAMPLAWYLWFLARMSPRRCPGCGKAGFIPLMKAGKQDPRSGNTRWCAGCGGEYWRDRHRVWQEDRRMTWHDRQINQGRSSTSVEAGLHVATRMPEPEVAPVGSTTCS
jgi:hypothetical protein